MQVEYDRVRAQTNQKINNSIEQATINNIQKYGSESLDEINERLIELEKEWAIERWLELNASSLAFIGLALGVFVNVYWLLLPAVVLPFLFLHAVSGWCPPVPLLRRLNVRTRREIDWEKFALKFLRGDFDRMKTPLDEFELFSRIKKVN